MSVTAGVRPFPLATQRFYSFVSHVCHWWCPPFSAVSIHLPPTSATASVRPFPLAMQRFYGLSLAVSCPCSISIHLSPRSVTARSVIAGVRPCSLAISIHLSCRSVTPSVRPFPLATQHFFSSRRSVTVGVRPCPLAMQHFYSCVSQVCHWLVGPALFCWPCSISILLSLRFVTGASLSIGHEAFLFICLPGPSLLVHVAFLLICLSGLRWP